MQDPLILSYVFTLGAYYFFVLFMGLQLIFNIFRLRHFIASPVVRMCGIAMLADSLSVLASFLLEVIRPANYEYLMTQTGAFDVIIAFLFLLIGEAMLSDRWPSKKVVFLQGLPLMALFIVHMTMDGGVLFDVPVICMVIGVMLVMMRLQYKIYRHDKRVMNYYSNIEGRTFRWFIGVCLVFFLEPIFWILLNIQGFKVALQDCIYNIFMVVFWMVVVRYVTIQAFRTKIRKVRMARVSHATVERQDETSADARERTMEINEAVMADLREMVDYVAPVAEDGADVVAEPEEVLNMEEESLIQADADSSDTKKETADKYQACQRMGELMDEKKWYKIPDLNVAMLAGFLETNRTYVSHYINSVLDTTFYDYVNSFRIRDAKVMLRDTDYKIDVISMECGFSSSASFIRVFQRINSCTPTQWRRQFA